jgi:cellulose synthase/poly-beta-1,6-N-acetylglucosamine synthase-like glycosyltransferase
MNFLPELEFSISTIIFFIFLFVGMIQLLYVLIVYGKFAFYKEEQLSENNFPPLSVLISARNESDNLFENLPFILEQDYPNFEVIVINHQSIDDSNTILHAYQRQYKNLRTIEVEKSRHLKPGKKLPLTLGIKGAKFENLVFTDADCKPSSNQWLKSVAKHFGNNKQIVLGYGPYIKKDSFLNKVIRFDTVWIAMNYFSMALNKMPYMGVGRNLAYTKSLFDSVSGFKSHYSLASGDDDLFIQETATKDNFRINIDKNSYCYSDPCETWEDWYLQKSRHFTTSDYYDVIKKLMLGIYPLTMLILLISFVILLFDTNFTLIVLSILCFIICVKWLVFGKCFKKLDERSLLWYLPLYDIGYSILMPILFYTTDKKEIKRW